MAEHLAAEGQDLDVKINTINVAAALVVHVVLRSLRGSDFSRLRMLEISLCLRLLRERCCSVNRLTESGNAGAVIATFCFGEKEYGEQSCVV